MIGQKESPPDQRVDALRVVMRDALERAPAFHELPAKEQHALAKNLMTIGKYLDDPHPGLGSEVSEVARALDQQNQDATEKLKDRLAAKPTLVGKDFKAGATEAGTKAFSELVKSVDFVGFVAGLIDGVYNSIVQSSIKQMMAFATFLEAVAKSAEEFASERVTPNQARDFLVNKFPNALELQGMDQGTPTVGLKEDIDDKDKPDFQKEFGHDISLDDDGGEQALVQAAQVRMARQRQQMLSQLLLMGINRIVVTEGEIKASVLFDVTAQDKASRTTAASMDDTQTHVDQASDGNIWGTNSNSTTNTRVSTAHADTKDQSDSRVDAHAKMTGYVQVKFKSETFPLERLASGDQQSAIEEKSKR